jgi:3'-phosphoadenosine 5'-phosphosulfate sulfotransferase (PAPS reductase)/FAD synthetase
MSPLSIPDQFRDDPDVVIVANMSGGKDSTALGCALREAGIPHRRVFADTGWEAPETYAHLDFLREKLGPIDVVGYPGGMPAKIREGARFASRMQRWCTKELKLFPLRAYFDEIEASGSDAVCTTGIRAEEGTDKNGRATMPEVEDDHVWGGVDVASSPEVDGRRRHRDPPPPRHPDEPPLPPRPRPSRLLPVRHGEQG